MAPGVWRYPRSHAPEGPRDALRLQLLDEGPRARVRGEAHKGRVPRSVRRHDAQSARDPRAHARRRVELARAAPGTFRRGLEERAAARRLSHGQGIDRPLAARRARDEGMARDARRRSARADPRSRAELDDVNAEESLPALVLRPSYPHPHAAAARRRGGAFDSNAAVAGEHRGPRLRRLPAPEGDARGLTRGGARGRAT